MSVMPKSVDPARRGLVSTHNVLPKKHFVRSCCVQRNFMHAMHACDFPGTFAGCLHACQHVFHVPVSSNIDTDMLHCQGPSIDRRRTAKLLDHHCFV